jgi:CO dehydrogenase maturation factor
MAGKGGTGKTTIASLIVKIISEAKLGSIIAIDADPNSNLAEALGIKQQETVSQIIDAIEANPAVIPPSMGKDAYIDYRIQTAITEGDGFDFLSMGNPEGPGCYCYVNNTLRNCLAKIIKNYDFIIIDNEAGLEHLSRRTAVEADTLLIISDSSIVGLRSAKRIADLRRQLKIKVQNEFLIINRFSGSIDREKTAELGLNNLGSINHDHEIEESSLKSGYLLGLKNNNAAVINLSKLGEKIWRCS